MVKKCLTWLDSEHVKAFIKYIGNKVNKERTGSKGFKVLDFLWEKRWLYTIFLRYKTKFLWNYIAFSKPANNKTKQNKITPLSFFYKLTSNLKGL